MPSLLELAKAHGTAEDRRDVAATVGTFTDDCLYTVEAFRLHNITAVLFPHGLIFSTRR